MNEGPKRHAPRIWALLSYICEIRPAPCEYTPGIIAVASAVFCGENEDTWMGHRLGIPRVVAFCCQYGIMKDAVGDVYNNSAT